MSAADYEPCPGCGMRRWRGLPHPVCDRCESTLLDPEWLAMRRRLKASNASLNVMTLLDSAIIADCRERLQDKLSAQPVRRKIER